MTSKFALSPRSEVVVALRVLVVDDHDSLRDLFRICIAMEEDLEMIGAAGDGLEALDLATALQPDAIVLDWELPHLDGAEALPILLRAAPGATVVVFSADSDQATAAFALAGGASRYLVKDDSGVADVIAALHDLDHTQTLSA